MAFTYFFRDLQTLELLTKYVIPVVNGNRYIRVWDAGCAHGPEPFSIAILIREEMSHFMFRNVQITATDIDTSSQFGEIIRKGIYPENEVKRIPKDIREKYFSRVGNNGHFQVSDEIRGSVEYSQHDLLTLKLVRSGFNLVVCKNVLLHFALDQQIDVIRMFHDALNEGGFLITEQTQKLPNKISHLFKRVTTNGQLFQKAKV